jgi:hypothetical protein
MTPDYTAPEDIYEMSRPASGTGREVKRAKREWGMGSSFQRYVFDESSLAPNEWEAICHM